MAFVEIVGDQIMSLELMKYITDEFESVEWNQYPSIYTSLGFNSSDIVFLALETGIYKWMQAKRDQWKNISCPSVGIITIVPPIPFATTLKTEITIAPLSQMDVEIPSPWSIAPPALVVIPSPLRLSTFLHQAFNPDYLGNPLTYTPLPHNKEEFAKAFFDAICMWMNSVWTISISDPENPTLTNAQGTGVILFPGVKIMGDVFAQVISLYRPTNNYIFFAILAFFLMLGVQGNLALPIPTTGIAPAGPYVGLTCPLPFPLISDLAAPSLPSLPTIGLPNIKLPSFTLPPFPTFTIPDYPGLPGFPDVRFEIPVIDLSVVLPILGLPDWSALVKFLINALKTFPFTLGDFQFWTLNDFEFRLTLPNFGPFTLDDILVGFKLTLPEFCNKFNLFSLPTFKLPKMTLLWWPPTVLLCSDGDYMSILAEAANATPLFKEAYENGTMSGVQLSAVMKNMCTSGTPPPPTPTLGGFSTGFSPGFEVYIYDAYIPEENTGDATFCRLDYNIFTSATFVSQINNNRDNATAIAEAYANIASIEVPIESIEYALYTIPRVTVKAYKSGNGIPFVREY